MNNYTNEKKTLQSTQTSVVIPTAELVKEKKVDLRVLACVSAISNVDDWSKEGSNTRHCTVKKLNKNLENMSELMNLDRAKLMKRIRDMANSGSCEFKLVKRECEGAMTPCVEISYSSGGFITIECGLLEGLLSTLSNNAFKLYINLLWLCRDGLNNKSIEKAISQEYLCQSIGLAKSSTKTIRKLENELIDNNLLLTRVVWETVATKLRLKKYYKLLSA